jgi:hypothetical protein
MAGKRAHMVIPEELIDEIDSLVGRRGRSRFIISATEHEVRRQQQLKALEQATGSWKDKDHPELEAGSRAWVRKIRKESERRFVRLQRHG